jgi:multiple sugar transport system substrate-binding protein
MIGRRSERITLALVVLAMTAACESEPQQDEATRITVMVSGDPEEIEAYRAVVEAFDRSQTRIDVELLPFADRDDLIVRLSTSIAGGQPPDLFLMNYRYYGQFAARDALEPVDPYLRTSEVFSADDFFQTSMMPFQWDGEQMCLPQNVSSLVVYYNADRFLHAGLPLPAEGWTWDDMVRSARALTRDHDGDGAPEVYGLGVDPEIIRLAPFIWSNGGRLVDDGADPSRFQFDAPAVTAMQRFLDLRSVHGVTPTDVEAESEDFETRFLNGRLGMLMESRRVVPTLRTITSFRWDVAPVPILSEPTSVLHADAYCITEGSDAKDASWRFVEFALGPEGQRITAEAGRTVPSLRSVADSDAFLDPAAPPEHSQVFLDQIPRLRAVPAVSTWAEIEDVANGILEEAYYGGGEALEVAVELTIQTRNLFARAEG